MSAHVSLNNKKEQTTYEQFKYVSFIITTYIMMNGNFFRERFFTKDEIFVSWTCAFLCSIRNSIDNNFILNSSITKKENYGLN